MVRKHLVFDPGDEECEKSVKNLQESSEAPVDFRIFRHSYSGRKIGYSRNSRTKGCD